MLIELQNVDMCYKSGLLSQTGKQALQGVSFSIASRETVGLFGKSGSGKTTAGHILAGMLRPTGGTVLYKGTPVRYPYRGELRRNVQVVFQHPESAFNPRRPIVTSLLETYRMFVGPDYRKQMEEDMKLFGIYQEHLNRFPSELSGGELQRMVLMRILAVRPELLILDEATSMLDVISQAQILQLLREYQHRHEVAYLFISHNHTLCKMFCDRMLYIENGRLEVGIHETE